MNASAQVTQWLLTRDWGELTRHFSSHPPIRADEYHARALMKLHQVARPVDIDWAFVISDLRQACSLNPSNALMAVNLTQALLDSRQPQEAYETAKQTFKLHPNAYPVMEKLALAADATHRWAEALATLKQAKQTLAENQLLPPSLERLLVELSSRWWEPIVKDGVVLRHPDNSDADFLTSTFNDVDFMQRYHRFQEAGTVVVKKLIVQAHQPLRQTRRIDWIVLDRIGNRVGLAAIVDIDWRNERGELLIGLPGQRNPMISLKASVAVLEFAFKQLRLAKMVSYVYGDNPEAQTNTLHLGFKQEGLLRSHIASPSGRLDLLVNGMTRNDFADNALLNKLVRRWSAMDINGNRDLQHR